MKKELKQNLEKTKEELRQLKEEYKHEIEQGDKFRDKVNNYDGATDSMKYKANHKYREDNPIYDDYRRASFESRILENELEDKQR